MHQHIRDQWVERLKSGKYLQGKNRLRNTEGDVPSFCCLGVLCEMYIEQHKGEIDPDMLEMWVKDGYFLGKSEFPPPQVVTWAGMQHFDPLLKSGGTAATANDNGKSFTEIADAIAETPAEDL